MANYYFKLKVGTSGIETRYDMPIKESVRYALDETGGVAGVHPYPLYDYIYGKDICVDINHKDCGKTLFIKLYRDDDTLIYEDTLVVPKHIYRYCKLFTDTVNNETYTVASSFSIFLDVEQAPLHYYINKVDLDKEVEGKHIQLLVTDGDESVVTNNTGFDIIGNQILAVEDIILDKDGYFIDENGNKKTFYLNCTYNTNGELEEGSWNDYQNNNEPFEEDQKYYLYIVDKDFGELIIADHYTPKTTPIGLNPIWDKIYFPGQLITLFPNRNISDLFNVSSKDCIFYSSLFGNTHFVNREGGIIYSEGENEVDSIFCRKNREGCIKLDPNTYVRLPNRYQKDNYDDLGFSSNIWPGDILDTKPYNKISYDESTHEALIDNYGNYVNKWGDNIMYLNGYKRSFVFKVLLENQNATDILRIVSRSIPVFKVSCSNSKFILFYDDNSTEINHTISINTWYTIQIDFVLNNSRITLEKAILTKDGETSITTTINALLSESIIDTSIGRASFTQHFDTDYIEFVSNTSNIVYISKCLLIGALPSEYEEVQQIITDKITNSSELNPKLVFTYDDNTNVVVSYDNFIEAKDDKIMAYLPENNPSKTNLPIGKATLDLMIGDKSCYHKRVEIQSMIPDDNTIDFDINFGNNFEEAVEKFKDIFYARQEHRGGDSNFGGGENANNIYFCRDGYAVFENHGDYYKGDIPANKKDSGDNRWYGGADDLIQYQLDENNEPISYNEQSKPNPYKRVTRVGSLVQSKRYYGYGAFEIEMRIPKDFRGSAICWWMFHYQEHYPDTDNRYLNYYVGGINENKSTGDDNPANVYHISDYTGTYDYNGSWNYLHCFKTDSGKPYLIINNEIDMELGSEGCNTFCSINPNSAGAPYIYFPALDERTAITCTSNDSDRGMWIADLSTEKSQSAIQRHWQNIQNSIGEDGYVDTKTCQALGISPNELTWVHVSNIVDSGTDNSTHTTRALRWNNWWTEPDISTNTIELNHEQYTNAVKQLNGDSDIKDGVSGFGFNNTVGALTIRTPLGKINLNATEMKDRYIPHYMDDDQWHTWRFEWTDKITRCYIDGELIKTNTANIPFIPMPFLIGVWFPSYKAYDNNYVSNPTSFGGWGGEHAPWDVRHLQVRRIKYNHYTEEEAPRDRMLYHAESFPYSGLREILTDNYETPVDEYIVVTLNNVPENSVVSCDSQNVDVVGNNITAKKNDICTITVEKYGYKTWSTYVVFDKNKSINVELELKRYTIDVRTIPSNAVIYNPATAEMLSERSFTYPYNTQLNLNVQCQGYASKPLSLTFNDNKIITVELSELPSGIINIDHSKSVTTVVPENGYDGTNLIGETTDDTNNIRLLVSKNVSLGNVYVFKRNYEPVIVELPTVTDDNNPVTLTIPFGEEQAGHGTKLLINTSVNDTESIIPILELDWGDGYRTIPVGFNELYINYGTSWRYRVSYPNYITQEGTISPETLDPSIDITLSVQLQRITNSSVTITMTPNDAQCSVTADGFETVSVTGNSTIELPKGKTYTFTVSKEGYTTQSVDKYIIEDEESISITLEEEVKNGDINLYNDDYGTSVSKARKILDDNATDEIATWLFMTDTHDNYESVDSGHISTTQSRNAIVSDLYTLADNIGCSCILHGGDSVGYDSSNDNISNIEQVLSNNVSTTYNTPVLYTIGNHDSQGRGTAFATQIDPSVIYNKCVAPFADKLTYTDTEYYSTNSYYDDVTHKIRFISIDNYFDANYKQWNGTNLNRTDQLAQAAINSTPSDHKIVILSHDIVGPNWYGSNSENQLKVLGNTNKTYFSYDKYSSLYDTLKANCPNFSNVILFLHGHYHNSNQSVSNDKKLFISTESAAIDGQDVFNSRNNNYDNYSAISWTSNTQYSSCHACDLFIYNKTKQTLDVIRFGRGGDRHFELNKQVGETTAITMARGNLSATLTSSTITDFSNYYILISTNPDLNVGYLDNYKFSTVLKATASGNVDTHSADGTIGTIISIPINCDYTVQLCKYEGYKYIGKKLLGTYNWNKDNNYTVELGEVSVD